MLVPEPLGPPIQPEPALPTSPRPTRGPHGGVDGDHPSDLAAKRPVPRPETQKTSVGPIEVRGDRPLNPRRRHERHGSRVRTPRRTRCSPWLKVLTLDWETRSSRPETPCRSSRSLWRGLPLSREPSFEAERAPLLNDQPSSGVHDWCVRRHGSGSTEASIRRSPSMENGLPRIDGFELGGDTLNERAHSWVFSDTEAGPFEAGGKSHAQSGRQSS